jgi:hypothetical protein
VGSATTYAPPADATDKFELLTFGDDGQIKARLDAARAAEKAAAFDALAKEVGDVRAIRAGRQVEGRSEQFQADAIRSTNTSAFGRLAASAAHSVNRVIHLGGD